MTPKGLHIQTILENLFTVRIVRGLNLLNTAAFNLFTWKKAGDGERGADAVNGGVAGRGAG